MNRAHSLGILGILTALAGCALSGCAVEPFCVNGCDDELLDGGGVDGDVGNLDGGDANGDGAIVPRDVPCIPSDGGELCNELDDDCDGMTDEDFDLTSSPVNCGTCGTVCRFPNAEVACNAGMCEVTACLPGFADLDGVLGCEVMCPVFPLQTEDCNGIDEDCDGMIDEPAELPAPPAGLCRTTPGTPCSAVVPTCATRSGRTTWFCDYPTTVEFDPILPNGIVLEETRCDGQDGDCDGVRDEPFAELGNACDDGARGACRDVGAISCDPADASLTLCDLGALPDPVPGAPSMEVCNGIDDDCDGVVDNSDPTDPARVRDDMVHVVRGALNFWIYTYEASRPDGTGTDAGTSGARACSTSARLPWASVAYDDAEAACIAAGHRMCTGAEWLAACEGAAGRTYPYGDTYATGTCNGADRDAIPGGGIDSRVEVCGSLASCISPDGALDLSGNLKEWTNDARGTSSGGRSIYVIRGGSIESPRLGLTCDTTLSRATEDTILPTLGFRCCDSDGP